MWTLTQYRVEVFFAVSNCSVSYYKKNETCACSHETIACSHYDCSVYSWFAWLIARARKQQGKKKKKKKAIYMLLRLLSINYFDCFLPYHFHWVWRWFKQCISSLWVYPGRTPVIAPALPVQGAHPALPLCQEAPRGAPAHMSPQKKTRVTWAVMHAADVCWIAF